MQDFAKQAEDLAEFMKRSLIFEGFPEAKAQEITIEETVAVCRESSTSDVVKSVLAASKFKTPQDAIAKFLTESDTKRFERQVLALRQFNRGRSQNNRGRDNNRGYRCGFRSNRGRGSVHYNNYNNNNYYNCARSTPWKKCTRKS